VEVWETDDFIVLFSFQQGVVRNITSPEFNILPAAMRRPVFILLSGFASYYYSFKSYAKRNAV
jgi:hypothetical protein